MINKKITYILLIQLLLVFTLIFYLIARGQGNAPVFLFWLIIFSIIFLSIIAYKQSDRYRILSLIILEVAITSIYIVSFPNIFNVDIDEVFESQYAQTIREEGKWNPTLGKGLAENYYGYNPVLHFVLAFSSITTGLSTFFLTKFIFITILNVFFILSVYMLISKIFKKEDIAYLSTLIFIGTPGLLFLGVTRRMVASIFVLITLYFLLNNKNNKFNTLYFIIFSIMIVLGNHSISYLFLIFLFFAWIFSLITKKEIYAKPFNKFLYFFIILAVWNIFFAYSLISKDITYILEMIKTNLIQLGFNSVLGLNVYGPPEVHINHIYETVIAYGSQFIFLFAGLIGFLIFLFKPKKYFKTNKRNFLLFLGFFGFLMYIFSALLMRTNFDVYIIIFLWFFIIPITIFSVYSFILISKKIRFIMITFFVLTIFSGGLIIGYSPTLVNRAPNEGIILELNTARSQELYNSGLWLSKQTKNATLIGDVATFVIYSGFFRFDVATDYRIEELYLSSPNDFNYMLSEKIAIGTYTDTIKYYPIDYLVINNAVYKYPSFTFGKALKKDLTKFDNSNQIDKIYSNKETMIYHNPKIK